MAIHRKKRVNIDFYKRINKKPNLNRNLYKVLKQGFCIIIKKGENMNKKGFITHPIFLAFCAFIIGMVLMYLLAKGIIQSPLKIC